MITKYELDDIRKKAAALREEGYTLTVTREGWDVRYGEEFVRAARILGKYKGSGTQGREQYLTNLETAVIVAERHRINLTREIESDSEHDNSSAPKP